ncbi:hypothetical protein [Streptomyces sp. NPDC088350]|uniref:hypothetical protein n=1 Tax=Streptomyces sp. NPDC088350 TaxID=3365854 RepID=UPI0037F85653
MSGSLGDGEEGRGTRRKAARLRPRSTTCRRGSQRARDPARRATATRDLGTIDAAHLREAHRILESGSTIGKVTLTGF